MESPQASPQEGAGETPTQKQARLRRERREAKLKTEGTSRLEKITRVSGRQNLPDPPPSIGTVPSDPDEVDLSSHPAAAAAGQSFNASQQQQQQQQPVASANQRPPTEADIRAMLRAGAPQPGIDKEGPSPADDPMMKILSQLMGEIPPGSETGEGDANIAGLPPGLAAMLGAGRVGGAGGVPAAEQEQDTYGYLWRIVHVVLALCLGIYVTATSSAFIGGMERSVSGGVGARGRAIQQDSSEGLEVNLFLAFATVELVLQTSRLVLEKGNGGRQLAGWIGLIAGFLPEPYRGYVALAGRYATIWATVVEDAMVVVFVVGCVAWWKGAVR